ncbi:MAG: hypothetical protein A2754_01190 [Candidatus Magasanikbacteria bacterium RIFCSPHIGHO2_01_FULL_47_8]|uniref:Uncharacterized protein n=1 Tax=Candidatus Magasanikbacteria bacterium RIFCSPHIGHO2_01_FULL_47_8 TaxID=1798673 RepID=A0A1F6MFB5_9BACT|nr:MAG: hypothetical protein A2754_01190 [Candidatus Magasanikbacteria bacterium RIFCSPHIGHO2_01_FULL_47_8]
MLLLRKYQLDIIFLFFGISSITWTIFYFIKSFGKDPHNYEWYVGAPLLAIYCAVLWRIREKINRHDRRELTGATLFYWITFGLVLFLSYAAPLPAREYWSIETFFIIFTIFLADSYWNFKKLTLKTLFKK